MKKPMFARYKGVARHTATAFMYAEMAKLAHSGSLPFWRAARLMALADAAFWVAGGDRAAAAEALREAALMRRQSTALELIAVG